METRQTNRAAIQQLLSDKSDTQALVPHPVTSRNLKIREGLRDAIVVIGEMNPKDSLPPIVAILDEMIKLTEETQVQNKNALTYAITYLSQADEMQRKDFTVALAEVQKNGLLDKMIPALERLVKEIDRLELNATLKPLAEELALWLEGLYFHTLKKPQPIGWLKISLPDPEDVALRAATFGKVNKLMVATYYHEAALALEGHLKKLAETKEIDVEAARPISLAAAENNKEDEPDQKVTVLQQIQQVTPNISLDKLKNKPIESKFPLLALYVDMNELTPIQKRAMDKFKPEITSTLGEYIINWWFFKPTHLAAMQSASNDIENNDDPAYWINRLYQLWNYLNKQDSHHALPKVTLLLNTACDLLHSSSKILICNPRSTR